METQDKLLSGNQSLSQVEVLTTGLPDFVNAITLEALNLQQCIREFNAGIYLVVRDIP